MFIFFQISSFKDFNEKPTEILFERFKTKPLVCYVLPGELLEFPVIRNNTPSRDEVRKVSWTLNSAFKLKLSRNKQEIVFFYPVLELAKERCLYSVLSNGFTAKSKQFMLIHIAKKVRNGH